MHQTHEMRLEQFNTSTMVDVSTSVAHLAQHRSLPNYPLSPPNFKIKALSMLPVEEVSEADLMASMAEVLPA